MKTTNARICKWKSGSRNTTVDAFVKRWPVDPKAKTVATRVLADIRRRGDRAVVASARKFDSVDLRPSDFRLSPAEVTQAIHSVESSDKKAIQIAKRRIVAFARSGMKRSWSMRTRRGGRLGEQFAPFDRVGIYVPGGEAPLASTALMTATLASVAGVQEIVACTPCDGHRTVNPVLVYALSIAGVTEIYRLGGIQAIGAMAYGTSKVAKVQKIVGPGNAFVTAAKQCVYGDVALDLVAGPSEICILADTSADARFVAADLISQAEHGTGDEKALLITTSARLAGRVSEELGKQASVCARETAIRTVMRRGMLLVVVPTLNEGMLLCNQFAPEHLELMVRNPGKWAKRVTCAGAIFIGPWSPEAAGDFVAGPSHVLPTGGAAALFSGLTVDDFLRRTSVIAYTRADLVDALPVIEAFGKIEGLDGHARSAGIRFDS